MPFISWSYFRDYLLFEVCLIVLRTALQQIHEVTCKLERGRFARECFEEELLEIAQNMAVVDVHEL